MCGGGGEAGLAASHTFARTRSTPLFCASYPDKVKTFWGYGPDERTDKVAEAASHLQDKFEASLRRVKDFNRREEIFGLPVSECVACLGPCWGWGVAV